MALINSLESGVTALKSFTKGIDVIGNNIANVNTVGFKASRVDYSETFSNTLKRSVPSGGGAQGNTTTMQIGSGVKLGDIRSRFTQGTLSETSVPSDLAITGEGFFVVRDGVNDANFATRAGNFRVDNTGHLVTANGYRLQGHSGATLSYDATVDASGELTFTPTFVDPSATGDLQVDFNLGIGSGITNSTGGLFSDAEVLKGAPQVTNYEFNTNGEITVTMSNNDTYMIGKVLLTKFSDPQALVHAGNGLFTNWDAAGVANDGALEVSTNSPEGSGYGSIESGKLELSNVELTDEFANIITMQRSFQAGARIVTTSDAILEEVVNLKR